MGKLNDGGLAGTGSFLDFGHRAGAPAHVHFSFKASPVNFTSPWFSSSPAVRVNRTDRREDTASRHGTGGIRERPESHAGSPHLMSILCLYIPERNPMRPAHSGPFLTRMVQLIRSEIFYTHQPKCPMLREACYMRYPLLIPCICLTNVLVHFIYRRMYSGVSYGR